MNYIWYRIFNLDEFLDTGLVSRTYTLILENLGQKDFLVTQGAYTGITYEGVFLPIELNAKNPFEFDDHAVYLDEDTQDVYWGFGVPEDDDES